MDNLIMDYLPPALKRIREYKLLMNAEQPEFEELWNAFDQVTANQFLDSADQVTVERLEKTYAIVSSPEESIEFRKERIRIRYNMNEPYTKEYLKQKLDLIIGSGNYELDIDVPGNKLQIGTVFSDATWFNEISILINRIKPAVVVYIASIFVSSALNINEEISGKPVIFYRLGSWPLGLHPFQSFGEEMIYKVDSISSATPELFNDVASHIDSAISSIVLNDEYEVTTFNTETEAGIVFIEYELPFGAGITEITNIKLKSGNTAFFNADVYIPVVESVSIKHKINIKEVA